MQVCSASITTPGATGANALVQVVSDLLGQPLLRLRPGGEVLDQPGQLGQPENTLARQVTDLGNAGERQQMVLAHRTERDFAGDHQLVVALDVGERGQPQRLGVE